MTETEINIAELMLSIGERAAKAARELALASSDAKNKALRAAAASLRNRQNHILSENAKDLKLAEEKGLSGPMLDRLALNEQRLEAVATGMEDIALLADPVGDITDQWDRPNGLLIQRKRVPLGVIGVIYESRPNVTADAGALCLKAGNAAVLRGGSESFHSSGAILECLHEGLTEAGITVDAIQRVPTRDRAAVGEMLRMDQYIDVIVPRGGKSLVQRVSDESRVPMFKHLEGICHCYVDKSANAEMAEAVVVNAKMRRTSICGSAETLLIDRAADPAMLTNIIDGLIEAGCEVRGDAAARAVDNRMIEASEDDFGREFLDSIIAVKTVNGVGAAIDHIDQYGSQHTDCIITEDASAMEEFINRVDSAIVMVNASTQYADGAEFGMGAEIGISTGKLHARGPVGVEQLTSSKYVVRGNGQCRP